MPIAATLQQAEKGWFDYRSISFDAVSTSGCQIAQSSYSWSHTTNGLNRHLLVGVSLLSAAGTTVTGITYNSVAMTFVRSDSNGVVRTELWRLTAPTLGTNTIAVTLSASITSDAGAVSFSGVDQTSPVDSQAGATGSGDPSDGLITTITDNAWVVDVIATSATAISVNIIDGREQTLWNNSCTVGSGAASLLGPITPPGLIESGWGGLGALDIWSMSTVALKPFTVSTTYTSPHHMALMGMGV